MPRPARAPSNSGTDWPGTSSSCVVASRHTASVFSSLRANLRPGQCVTPPPKGRNPAPLQCKAVSVSQRGKHNAHCGTYLGRGAPSFVRCILPCAASITSSEGAAGPIPASGPATSQRAGSNFSGSGYREPSLCQRGGQRPTLSPFRKLYILPTQRRHRQVRLRVKHHGRGGEHITHRKQRSVHRARARGA
jgi:hypothetical protein